jgi:hypothetical protein
MNMVYKMQTSNDLIQPLGHWLTRVPRIRTDRNIACYIAITPSQEASCEAVKNPKGCTER